MSGFEGNTTLEAIPSSATSDDYQHFSGSDTTTGYTWPMSFWGDYAVIDWNASDCGRIEYRLQLYQ